MDKTLKIALITNIPAPYRIPVYEEVANKMGDDFLVFFSAKKEPNRSWNLGKLKFNHIFLRENIRNKKDGYNYIHNNPEIITNLRKFNPDVVITTGFNPTHLYSWLYTMLFLKKHIPMTDGTLYSEKHLSWLHKIVRKMVFKTSKAFIGASKNSLELYKSYGMAEEELFQSHLCVNNERFKNQKSFWDREYDLMFSGQFTERKLPFLFAEVAERVSKEISNLNVLILGDGPLKKEFFEKLDHSGVTYHYAGFISQEELPAYYSNARLFLFTTRLDPWGVVVNEAMASGTPVITTPYAGVVDDLIIDRENGYVLDIDGKAWADKAVKVLKNPDLWQQLSDNAKESVKKFNFENAAQGIIDACEYAIEN